MLTQPLRVLEEDSLVHRKAYSLVPSKVEYSFTEDCKELIPFINYLREGGAKRLKSDSQFLLSGLRPSPSEKGTNRKNCGNYQQMPTHMFSVVDQYY